MRRRTLSGNSLVGILVAFLVVVLAVVFFVTGGMGTIKNEEGEEYKRADGLGNTTLGRARYAAEDAACKTQLGQVRGLVSLASDPVDDTFPGELNDVGGLPNGYDKCPIGSEPYTYDAATGEVKCVHLGHEEY